MHFTGLQAFSLKRFEYASVSQHFVHLLELLRNVAGGVVQLHLHKRCEHRIISVADVLHWDEINPPAARNVIVSQGYANR